MLASLLRYLLSLVEGKKPAPTTETPTTTDKLPAVEESRMDLFRPSERLIYRYWNGEEEVSADPIELYKSVMEVWPDIDRELKLCTHVSSLGGFNDSFSAHGKMVDRIRKIFKIKPLGEGGLTDDELVGLIDHFLLYTMSVKKNSRLFPTVPMAILRALQSSSDENPPTTNSSDSGETATESSTDAPVPSNTESRSLSDHLPQDSITT